MDSHKKIITKKSTQLKWLFYADWVTSGQFSCDSIYLFFWSVIGGTSNLKDFGWNETSLKQLECFENDFDLFYSVNRNSFEVFGQDWMRKIRRWNDLWPNDTEMCKTKRFELKWFNTNQFAVWSIGEINSLEKIQSEKKRFEKKNRFKSKIDLYLNKSCRPHHKILPIQTFFIWWYQRRSIKLI